MKKFIDFLYIALLAVMPFALASSATMTRILMKDKAIILKSHSTEKHTKNTYRYSDMCFSKAHKPTVEAALSH